MQGSDLSYGIDLGGLKVKARDEDDTEQGHTPYGIGLGGLKVTAHDDNVAKDDDVPFDTDLVADGLGRRNEAHV